MARVDSELEVTCGRASAVARPDQPVVVGRDDECDLVVAEPMVSRRHAEVAWAGGGWLVRDLNSTNGLWRDGVRGTAFPVTDALELRIGGPDEGPVLRLRVIPAPRP